MSEDKKILDDAVDTVPADTAPAAEVPSEEAIKSDGQRDTDRSTEASGPADADADAVPAVDSEQAQVSQSDGHGLPSEMEDKQELTDDVLDRPADSSGSDSSDLAASDNADSGDASVAADGPAAADSDDGTSNGDAGGSDSLSELLGATATGGTSVEGVEPAATVPPTTDEAAPLGQPPLAELKPVSEVPESDETEGDAQTADGGQPSEAAEPKSDEPPEASKSTEAAPAEAAPAEAPSAPSAPTLGEVRGEVSELAELPREAVRSLRDAGISLFRFLAELESADDGLQGEAKARFSAVRNQTVQLLSTIERVFVRQG